MSFTVETGWVCLVRHTHPVSTVVIAWHTLFEPNISKYKPNITISESNITKFGFIIKNHTKICVVYVSPMLCSGVWTW